MVGVQYNSVAFPISKEHLNKGTPIILPSIKKEAALCRGLIFVSLL